ncbi:RNA polymerase sigma factor [Sphingobacterium humi]|uniref:RNA polymerase sigma-70 factor n=1 Tax=Sphingobacterium humi TaxID=1796905 RepID=A0A6N8L0T7_9SPHI|nr:RNA polymerase sigma-70 factor [Sphingobacterium humi]MVZ62966.1 RNA polymerase sigma-70 factor [Sphingobacterium humi]
MTNYAHFDDSHLIDLLQVRDQRAYTEIYNRFWPVLFRHARRMLQDDDEATDVVQDIFAKLWEKADAIKLSGNLAGYLYSATRNRVIDRIDRHRLEKRYLDSLANFLQHSQAVTEDQVLAAELARRIEEEVAKLPKKMQRIFLMRQEAEQSYKEIAHTIGTSEGNVKKQLYNAMKLLRSKLHISMLLICWNILSYWYRHFH